MGPDLHTPARKAEAVPGQVLTPLRLSSERATRFELATLSLGS